MKGPKHVLAALLLGSLSTVLGQEGSIDPTFNPISTMLPYGDAANGPVYAIVVQPNGKIIIGGSFTHYNNTPRNGIARLFDDGSLDPSFDPGTGANATVHSVVLQPDGRVLIGGDFTNYNGTVRNRVARLNSTGSLDLTFDPGSGANAIVNILKLQPNGKVLVGGGFTTLNGIVRNDIARLNADGSLDTGFNPGSGTNGWLNALALQTDGKVLVGGQFTSFNGTARNRVARLNDDGSLDTGFNPGSGANGEVWSIVLQPDGKVLIGGAFILYNGTPVGSLIRVMANGSLDASLSTMPDGTVFLIALFPNGQILISGNFTQVNSIPRERIARVNVNGSLDGSFDPGTGLNLNARVITLRPDGRALVGGFFSVYNGTVCGYLVCLNTDGSLHWAAEAVSGADGTVHAIALQPDGKVLMGGYFRAYHNALRNGIARVNSDGSLDIGFDPGYGTDLQVTEIQLQPDGKVLVAGYNGGFLLSRMETDGSTDATFNLGAANGMIKQVVLQPDGKVLVSGWFTQFNGTPRARITRLNPDGSLDVGFNPGTGANGFVNGTVLQADGKVIIGGNFTTYNATARSRIARLNANGSLDTSFDPGSGLNGEVFCLAVQPDGKVLLGGNFTSVNGTARNGVARLNADGSLDTGFDVGIGANAGISEITVQPDGKVLIGGTFSSYNGTTCDRIARLNTNGSLDTSFGPSTGANNEVGEFALQPDGRVLIGGQFTTYDAMVRNRIARIHGTARTGIKVMLEGPYSAGQMNDALRTLPSFPLTEPFTAMGYAEAAYVPGASIPASLLTTTGNNAIVDWVIVEMRPVATPNVVAASRAVLLQRDGDVVDLDGVSTVGFAGLAPGSYCVAVKPRTHLPVMLSTTTPVIYGDAIATVDFTLPATQVHDSDALKNVGGTMVLTMGDATFNEKVSYTGLGNDRDPILVRIGGSIPTATVAGYYPEDVNMDGVVKYVGVNNDRDPILTNVGGTTPTVVRDATLP